MKVNVNRGIVFVPSSDDVKQAIGYPLYTLAINSKLHYLRLSRVLQFWGVKEAHNLQKTLGIYSEKPLRGEGRAVPSASSSDLISRAVNSGVGASASLQIAKGREKELFVIPVSGSRGLHIQKVEYVIILRPPTTMDEYLHMAGRTGRTGSSGTVVTIANLEELKRMTSWQTALGIEFDVKYNAFT